MNMYREQASDIKEYTIVTRLYPMDFDKELNSRIKEGWQMMVPPQFVVTLNGSVPQYTVLLERPLQK